ncbi:MAG: hypothetical protein GY732_00410 [Gammaproteobacteria bacterium]|nr:hypothetical protein [Gammaproteobacteria bacterium]
MTLLKTTMLASLTLMLAAASAQSNLVFNFTKIVQTGDSAPGTSGTFTDFEDPAVDDDGNVAFNAYFRPGNEGTFGTRDGTLIKFSDQTTPFPGATFTLNDFDDHVEIRNGIALSFGYTPAISDDSLFTSDGTTGRLVAQEGVTVLPSAGNPVNTAILDTEGFGFDGTRVAFVARFSSGEGVYLDDGTGTLSKIADTSDTTPTGGTFTDFGNAMPDSNGDGILFEGSTASSSGIYVSENDVLSKVADNVTDFAPSAAGNNVRFGEPDVDGGGFAFTVRETGSVETEAVILADGSSLMTIADLTTTLPTGEMATDFEEVAIANGLVAFNAETASGESVFVWRNGVLNTVLSEGDMLDGLSVTNIQYYNRPFFADGFLALIVWFDNGSRAVYRVSFPPSTVVAEASPVPALNQWFLLLLSVLLMLVGLGAWQHTRTHKNM